MMKDVSFGIVLILSGLLLLLMILLQAASRSLKVVLILSVLMGVVSSFMVAMVAFTIDESLEAEAIYKIMFLC